MPTVWVLTASMNSRSWLIIINSPGQFLTLDTEGKMSWNNEAVTWDNFIIELIKYSEQDSPTILINFDQNANYGQAMSILNEIRKAPKPVKIYISTKLPKP